MKQLVPGLPALVLFIACGARSGLDALDHGVRADAAMAEVVADSPSDDGSLSISSDSSDLSVPSVDASSIDVGCGPNLLTYEPADATASCWACISKGCSSELAGCARDCTCNAALSSALTCAAASDSPTMCFLSNHGVAFSTVSACILGAGAECNCQTSVSPAPPFKGCQRSNGASLSPGNGNCSSTFIETCDGSTYQIICACPAGNCVCLGPSTQVVSFTGCPYCPGSGSAGTTPTPDQLLGLCGFPL